MLVFLHSGKSTWKVYRWRSPLPWFIMAPYKSPTCCAIYFRHNTGLTFLSAARRACRLFSKSMDAVGCCAALPKKKLREEFAFPVLRVCCNVGPPKVSLDCHVSRHMKTSQGPLGSLMMFQPCMLSTQVPMAHACDV